MNRLFLLGAKVVDHGIVFLQVFYGLKTIVSDFSGVFWSASKWATKVMVKLVFVGAVSL